MTYILLWTAWKYMYTNHSSLMPQAYIFTLKMISRLNSGLILLKNYLVCQMCAYIDELFYKIDIEAVSKILIS
jgi:hypothetical protein